MEKQRLASRPSGRAWTNPDDYIEALARKRRFRHARAAKPRTQAERPRLLLSTLPFLALIGLLGILAIGIMILAFPGLQPQHRESVAQAREKGVANAGWFQEAQKEMHR